MPTLRYALEANGPKRLALAWEGQYRHFMTELCLLSPGKLALRQREGRQA